MRHIIKSVFLVAISIVVVSCSKEVEVNAPDSLVGTSWLLEGETVTTKDGVEIGAAVEIDFTTATKGQINILIGGVSNTAIAVVGFEAGDFSYTYSKPTVKITADGETSTGKIDGNKLTIDGAVFEQEE